MILIVILLLVYGLQSSHASPLCQRRALYPFYKAEASHSSHYGQQQCSTHVDDNDVVRILLWGLHSNSPLVADIGTERVLDSVAQQLNRSIIEIRDVTPKPDAEFGIRATSHQNLAQTIKWYMSSQAPSQKMQYVIHATGDQSRATSDPIPDLDVEFRKYLNAKRKQEEIARLQKEDQ